jgi:Zn-dependent peptidase ImmA (M78 family)
LEKPLGDPKARNATVHSIKRASICLNPLKAWKIGFDGNLDAYDLRFTFMHEIGHALGLDHPEQRSQLMHFKYDESRTGLQAGDIAGAVKLYGPPPAR